MNNVKRVMTLFAIVLSVGMLSCEKNSDTEQDMPDMPRPSLPSIPEANSKTINVEIPGTLDELLLGVDKSQIIKLTITGNLDPEDLHVSADLCRKFSSISILDMHDAEITRDTGSGPTPTFSVSFRGCSNLAFVLLPKGIPYIDDNFFSSNNLIMFTIPNSVTGMGRHILSSECVNFQEYIVGENNKAFSSFNGVLFNKKKTILRSCPMGKKGDLKIPSSVVTIDEHAFTQCKKLTSIIIPENVTNIGEYAFSGCEKLASIIIPKNISVIKKGTFSGCTNLISIPLSNNITKIEPSAFWMCVNFKEYVVEEDNRVYSSLDGLLFNKKRTALIACPEGKEGTLKIPNNVIDVAERAFSSCQKLQSIIIPNSVTSIGSSAFSYCNNLKDIICYAEEPPIFNKTGRFSLTTKLYVPKNSIEKYINSNWGEIFKDSIYEL